MCILSASLVLLAMTVLSSFWQDGKDWGPSVQNPLTWTGRYCYMCRREVILVSDAELRVSDRQVSMECSPTVERSITNPVYTSPWVCAIPFGRAHHSHTRLMATEKSID